MEEILYSQKTKFKYQATKWERKKHTQRLQGNHHISSKGDNHNYLIMSINL